MTAALVKSAPINTNEATVPAPRSREFLERQAFEAFKAFLCAMQECLTCPPNVALARMVPEGDPASDVMTVDEAAAFLGVDRNTVYEYTTRGVIPHQRLGKRILLRRGALVAWLDASLCAPTTKGEPTMIERSPCRSFPSCVDGEPLATWHHCSRAVGARRKET